jgi:hypothetical protein
MRHIGLQDLKDVLLEIVRTAGREPDSVNPLGCNKSAKLSKVRI